MFKIEIRDLITTLTPAVFPEFGSKPQKYKEEKAILWTFHIRLHKIVDGGEHSWNKRVHVLVSQCKSVFYSVCDWGRPIAPEYVPPEEWIFTCNHTSEWCSSNGGLVFLRTLFFEAAKAVDNKVAPALLNQHSVFSYYSTPFLFVNIEWEYTDDNKYERKIVQIRKNDS